MSKVLAHVLSIGVINITTGKTMYDWSIYDHPNSVVSLTSSNFLLLSAPNTFNIGETVRLKGNDSGRTLHQGSTIVDIAPCTKDEVLAMLKKNGFDYYPIKAFRSRPKGNKKLSTSYSVKGTEWDKI